MMRFSSDVIALNPDLVRAGRVEYRAKPERLRLSGDGFDSQLERDFDADRRVIVDRHYSLEALHYLWDDARQDGDNPIGLFLYRVGQGMHSPAYLALLAERQAAAEESRGRPTAPAPPPPSVPDASLTQQLPGWTAPMTPAMAWAAALGELQLEMTRATFDTWVKPAILLSVNGTWKIGVPNQYAQEWLSRRLLSTVKRTLSGIVGQAVEPEFVVVPAGQGVPAETV